MTQNNPKWPKMGQKNWKIECPDTILISLRWKIQLYVKNEENEVAKSDPIAEQIGAKSKKNRISKLILMKITINWY